MSHWVLSWGHQGRVLGWVPGCKRKVPVIHSYHLLLERGEHWGEWACHQSGKAGVWWCIVFEGLVHATRKRLKPDQTKPQRNWTVSWSSGFSEIKNRTQLGQYEPVAIGFQYILNKCTFWAYFEEKRERIAWDMAKIVCYHKIWLLPQLVFVVFWDVEDSYHHKNFWVTYYTLYTIVYNCFYVIYTRKIPVLISFNWLPFKLVQTSLDRFLQFFAVSVWFFFCIFVLGN